MRLPPLPKPTWLMLHLRVGLLFLLLPCLNKPVHGQEGVSLVPRPEEGWLILFVYPASRPLGEENPRALLRSAIMIEGKRFLTPKREVVFMEDDGCSDVFTTPYFSTIGHTIALLRWGDAEGYVREEWASLSAPDFAGLAFRQVVREGRGMGILFDTYPDAYVLGREENRLRLFHYRGRREGRTIAPRYLAFALDRDACTRAMALIEDFRAAGSSGAAPTDPESGQGLVFSSVMDPYATWLAWRQGGPGPLGGGCAPFGIALLKAAGSYHPVMDTLWDMVLDIPEDLIGAPGRRVGIKQMLCSRRSRTWERGPGQSRHFVNADPQRIWDWVGLAGSAAPDEVLIPGLQVRKGPPMIWTDPESSGKRRPEKDKGTFWMEGVVIKPWQE